MEDQENKPPKLSGASFIVLLVIAAVCGWGALYHGASVIGALDTGEICVGGRRGCLSWEDDYQDMWWEFSERLFSAVLFGCIALASAFSAYRYMKAD